MMLDKGQIKDWDGEPEETPASKAIPLAQAGHQPGLRPDPQPASQPRPFGEALPTGEHVRLTPEQTLARKRRGQWIALGLFAFVIIIFLLTMTKVGASILVRDL